MAKTTDDLAELLKSDRVNLVELAVFLQDIFNRASQLSPTEIRYGEQDSNKHLTLTYTKDYASLDSIAFGSDIPATLLDELYDKLQEAFLHPAPVKFGNSVLFSLYPVSGYCTVGDIFQVVPAPPHAPRPPFSYADHPFILEFRFNGSKNDSVNLIRFLNRRTELSLLLSVLLEGQIIDSHLNHTTRHWVLIKEEDPTADLRSEYLQLGYSIPGLTAMRENFSSIGELDPMGSIHPDEYYLRFGIEGGRGLEVPADLQMSLERYHALDDKNQKRFLHACYWSHQANRIYHHSRSASYLSLVSAIECLMDEPRSRGRCKECNREWKVGPTKVFRDFIEKFAPRIPSPERNEVYQIRSKLAHGGALLPSDVPGLTPGLDPKFWESVNQYGMISEIVRSSMYNWLHQ